MQTLICKNCGSTSFSKIAEGYRCQHCGSTIVRKTGYSKKRIRFISGMLVAMLVIGILIYIGIVGVEKKIDKIATSKQTPLASENLSVLEQKIKKEIAEKLHSVPIKKILEVYNRGASEKALYISLNRDGKYAYGYSIGTGSVREATQRAFEYCENERRKRGLRQICTPYLINDRISPNMLE